MINKKAVCWLIMNCTDANLKSIISPSPYRIIMEMKQTPFLALKAQIGQCKHRASKRSMTYSNENLDNDICRFLKKHLY